MTSKKVVPIAKFSNEVVKLCCECSLIWPFIARCTPTIAPAKTPRITAAIDKSLPSSRSATEIKTANTVTKAAVTRRGVICFFPPPVNPMRSTTNEIALWPAIAATE